MARAGKQGPSAAPTGTDQTELPLEQVQDGTTTPKTSEDLGISDVSVSHKIPKNNPPCRECTVNSTTFDDPFDQTIAWVTCELGLALAEGNLQKILEIIRREVAKSKCPVQARARALIASISAKIAQALSSEQVPEEFRSTDTSREDRVGGD